VKVFYGWVIVAAGIVISCIGMGAMSSLGIFLQPMAETMGWSRAGISAAALLNFLCMGAGAFLWGALSDRFGTRLVVLTGGILVGFGMVLGSQARTVTELQITFGVIVGLGVGSLFTPLTATTTRWFTRHRSLAVSLVTAGISVGVMVVGPLARWLTTTWDWRFAMLVIGDVVWLVIIPAALLVREPGTAVEAAGRSAGDGDDLTVAQALRTPQFAAIAITFFACCAAHAGPIFHMVSHAMDHGVPAMAAATVLSTASFASLVGKIGCGLVADRIGAKRVLVGGLALQVIAVSLYLVTRELLSFYAVAVVFGFAYGGVMPLYAIVIREYFGERIVGSVFGAAAFASTLGMAVGPMAGGFIYDIFGSYAWMFVASAAIGLGAVAVAFTFPSAGAVRLTRTATEHGAP
jgi:MFS family permease